MRPSAAFRRSATASDTTLLTMATEVLAEALSIIQSVPESAIEEAATPTQSPEPVIKEGRIDFSAEEEKSTLGGFASGNFRTKEECDREDALRLVGKTVRHPVYLISGTVLSANEGFITIDFGWPEGIQEWRWSHFANYLESEFEKTPVAQERVYVPHMEQWGTVQQVYGDGQLIGVMLDSGIFMQTNRAFTRSQNMGIHKEDSIKFPLTNREALQTAEVVKTFQLSLF
jgi:hypothetical protein